MPVPRAKRRAPQSGPGSSRHSWKNGPASCSECIRLKRKCSRAWPCTNCVKRGCGSLCPFGTTSPSGASQESMTIKKLLSENRALSDALQRQSLGPSKEKYTQDTGSISSGGSSNTAQTPSSSYSHVPPGEFPPDEQAVNGFRDDATNSLELAAPYVDGTGGFREIAGEESFYGTGAGAIHAVQSGIRSDNSGKKPIITLPFQSSATPSQEALTSNFPSPKQARFLVDIYVRNVTWMYQPTDRTTAERDLKQIQNNAGRTDELHPHRLSTLFIIFSLAELFESNIQQAITYFNLASNLLVIPASHFLSHPTIGVVETLHLMVNFLFCSGHRDSSKGAWTLLGICVRTAQALGLHCGTRVQNDRDVEWQSNSSVYYRSRVWWETMTFDLLQSLNFGRPYSTPLNFVGCALPCSSRPVELISRTAAFHDMKYDLALLYTKVSDALTCPEKTDYDTVLALDQELRNKESQAPSWFVHNTMDADETTEHMSADEKYHLIPQQHMFSLLVHKGLLALHRPWFAVTLSSGNEPMRTPYAASFNACLLSARKHSHLMRSILESCPYAANRWWFFPFHTFTAAVIQASALLHAPACMLSNDIRADFEESYLTIKEMAHQSPIAARAAPVLHQLRKDLPKENNYFSSEQSTHQKFSLTDDNNTPSNDRNNYHDNNDQPDRSLPTIETETSGTWQHPPSGFSFDQLFASPADALSIANPLETLWDLSDKVNLDSFDQTLCVFQKLI